MLEDILEAYFSKHLDIHRNKAGFDLVSQQTDMIRAELAKTENDLNKKKADAKIISLQDTANDLNVELANIESQINTATAALAQQRALVTEYEKTFGSAAQGLPQADGTSGKPVKQGAEQKGIGVLTSGTVRASSDAVEKYRECVNNIATLRKRGFELLSVYTQESFPVKVNDAQIAELEKERRDSEKKYPELLEQVPEATDLPEHRRGPDMVTERARLVSMEAGMEALQARYKQVQERAEEFAKASPEIEQLQRTEQLQQADYTTAQSKLQNASVDEALDPSKIPNISTVQKPSPAMRIAGTRQKIVLGLAGGGIGFGLALAMVIELFLDHTVKRPMELDQRLGIPLLLSIPYILRRHRTRLSSPRGKKQEGDIQKAVVKNGHATVAPWEVSHFIRTYAEAIRDRLGHYFEANNITHRPKLLAVIGSANGAGACTLAAGMASALSETGEGKVLLVDINLGQTDAHPLCSMVGLPARLPTALADKGSTDIGSGQSIPGYDCPERERRRAVWIEAISRVDPEPEGK